MICTIYKNLFEISTPFHKDVNFILQRIKEGKSKELVERIRSEANKEERNKLKEKLPAIIFSGIFANREDTSIKAHSGLICLDFDNYTTSSLLKEDINRFIKDEYSFAVFKSPSGNGIKVLVKIPPIKENHKGYFNALDKYYNSENFDKQCSNISRVCYESYDPDIFINENSKVFEDIQEEEGFSFVEKQPLVILDDIQEIINRLYKWFQKFPMQEGQRASNLFILASSFNEYGVPISNAEYFLSRFIEKDFTEKEINKIIRSAYSRTQKHGTKYFEDTAKISQVKKEVRSGKSSDEIVKIFPSIPKKNIEEIAQKNSIDVFWFVNKNDKISIDNLKYKLWLQQNGFFKFYPEGSESFIFIRIENNLIDNTTEVKVKDFVLNYLLEQGAINVYQYMTNQPKYFKDDILNTLDSTSVIFKNDTKDVCYLYFRNCAVEVSKKEIKKIDYIDLDGFVWKKHIIDADYSTSQIDCDYKKFIYNISGKDEAKEDSIKSTIGYLLSSYKNASNNVAVIINDELISENPNGGTGKGIFINAISRMKRISIIDGKSFDFRKSFPYQTVSADTQMIAFDDVPKNFPFENLFSIVTEGITLEKKNKDAIKIPISKSPKILITTNYAISGDGNSFDRRKWEIEFAQHYTKQRTPVDDFGRLLFDEWDEKEFNSFYSYMISCLQIYIKKGLISSEFNNLKVRQFIAKTTYDFYQWTEDKPLQTNTILYKSDKFEEFINDYPDFKKFLSRKRFTQWLEKYGEHMGYEVISGSALGARYITYKTNKEEIKKIVSDDAPF
jgi:hypothetical protein